MVDNFLENQTVLMLYYFSCTCTIYLYRYGAVESIYIYITITETVVPFVTNVITTNIKMNIHIYSYFLLFMYLNML